MAEILFESYYGTSSLGEPYLMHHGIKGQKWGKRRWQNEDGSLTPAGREHYGYGSSQKYRNSDGSLTEAGKKRYDRQVKKLGKLKNRTDVDLQKEKAQQYEKRASIAGKVAVASGLAAGGLAGVNPLNAAIVKRHDNNGQVYRDLQKSLNPAYTKLAGAKSYDEWKSVREGIDHTRDLIRKAGDKIDRENGFLFNASEALDKVSVIAKPAVTAAVGATAAVSAGVYAYNKIQGHLANKRVTDIGHEKAVEKYEAYRKKFEEEYGDVALSELDKLQHSDDDYLMHHGIKGQKWYHRRFQNEDGSLTTLGRLHYGIGKGRKEEGAKELVEAYDKKRKEEKAVAKATKAEVSKEKLLTSGNAKQILENSDMFTNQELQQAVNRLNMKRQLASLEPPKKSIVAVTTGLLNTAGSAMNAITNVKDAYEKMQRAFESDEEKEKRKAKERQEAREEAAEEGYKLALKKHVQEKAKEAMDDSNDSVSSRIKKAIQSKNDDLWPEPSKSNSNDVMDRIKQQVEASQKARIVKSINDSVNADNQRRENDAFISKLSSVSNKYESEREAQRQSDKNNAYDRIRKLMDSAGSTSTSAVSSSNSRSDNDSFISKLSSVANQYSSERETKTPSIFERAVGSVATGQSTVSSMPKASLSKRVGNLMSSVSDRASVDRGRELASSNNELLNKSLGFLDDLDKK